MNHFGNLLFVLDVVIDAESQSFQVVLGQLHLESGSQFLLFVKIRWQNGDACEQTVLGLGKETVLKEVFREVQTVDGPVFDFILFESQLPFHRGSTELYCPFVIPQLGVYLGHIEQRQSVILFKFDFVQASIYVKSEILNLRQSSRFL